MNIGEQIWACEKCPLYQKVEVSPLAPEYRGQTTGGVMCIIGGATKYDNDYTQEVITGVNRQGLMNILEDNLDHWYITKLIKCQSSNTSGYYTKETKTQCKSWIYKEIGLMKPSLVIGFGADVKEVIGGRDHPPWAKCDHYLPSVNNVLSNKKNRNHLNEILASIRGV